MKLYTVMYIYSIEAESKTAARQRFVEARLDGRDEEMLKTIVIKDDTPKHLLSQIKHQVLG